MITPELSSKHSLLPSIGERIPKIPSEEEAMSTVPSVQIIHWKYGQELRSYAEDDPQMLAWNTKGRPTEHCVSQFKEPGVMLWNLSGTLDLRVSWMVDPLPGSFGIALYISACPAATGTTWMHPIAAAWVHSLGPLPVQAPLATGWARSGCFSAEPPAATVSSHLDMKSFKWKTIFTKH